MCSSFAFSLGNVSKYSVVSINICRASFAMGSTFFTFFTRRM